MYARRRTRHILVAGRPFPLRPECRRPKHLRVTGFLPSVSRYPALVRHIKVPAMVCHGSRTSCNLRTMRLRCTANSAGGHRLGIKRLTPLPAPLQRTQRRLCATTPPALVARSPSSACRRAISARSSAPLVSAKADTRIQQQHVAFQLFQALWRVLRPQALKREHLGSGHRLPWVPRLHGLRIAPRQGVPTGRS